MKTKSIFLSIFLFTAPQIVYSVNNCRTVHGIQAKKARTDLYFKEKLGEIEEHSIRESKTAAHIYLDSSTDPYFFIGFQAGNSGVALWMKSPGEKKAKLQGVSAPRTLEREGGLNGVEIELKSNAQKLVLNDSVLGSMRFIRDRELGVNIPTEVRTKSVRMENGMLLFERESLNGMARYALEIEPTGDTRWVEKNGAYELTGTSGVQFRMRGFSSETPLTALAPEEVFLESALKSMDPKKLQAFSFLLYKEKLMAGSPRYFSKFGRDSIYTLRVLMDVMKPEAIESLLTATLSSMHPTKGLVSHEQHEGDFVSYVRMKRHEKYKGVNTPMEDYKMIDDDFAFTIVLSEYFKRYPDRVQNFLERKEQRGFVQKNLIQNLFKYVDQATEAFASKPVYQNLIGLKGHEKTGEWRDSENGLGGGKYPFDVNAAFVPAALKALVDVTSNPASPFYNIQRSEELTHKFQVWNNQVLPLFLVRISPEQAIQRGERYLKDLGINLRELPAPPKDDLLFPAISLAANGEPIPIIHSDDSLMMTFGYPNSAYLQTVSQRVQIQFPYGLATPVGILVANPVFASHELQQQFDETKYHGRVSWTMQEDLLIYGINRQLKRQDLASELKENLRASKKAVQAVVASKSSMGGTEVFSIFYRNGRYEAVPFAGDAKSNSNQLWSHLPLGF